MGINWVKDVYVHFWLYIFTGITEAEWLEIAKTGRITSMSVQGDTAGRITGVKARAVIEGLGKSVLLRNAEKPTNSHLSHLLFYQLDRLLGVSLIHFYVSLKW